MYLRFVRIATTILLLFVYINGAINNASISSVVTTLMLILINYTLTEISESLK
ncbi:hypothetical protein [Ligilactobacillus salivarius]|uniref:hypothetical protein n=1 Tax=Ligilactobacillus salivarius TaxID=1624 RepID=UPI00136BC457|nr:hypothetical protein [Ligilactobacillus salivarius]